MPLPGPEDTCLAVEIDIEALLGLSVTLPGGITIQAQLEAGQFPSLSVIVGKLLEPLNSALAPLMPFFNLLDVVLALIECVKAIPDSLGPPPNPTGIIKAIQKLAKAAAKLAAMLPPISIPIMIGGLCKVIIAALNALIEELNSILSFQASIAAGRERADALLALGLGAGAVNLSASLDCAQANLDLQLELSTASLGPLNKFLSILNAFASLAGLPEFVSIEASGDASAMLAPLQAAVNALDSLCGSLPV